MSMTLPIELRFRTSRIVQAVVIADTSIPQNLDVLQVRVLLVHHESELRDDLERSS